MAEIKALQTIITLFLDFLFFKTDCKSINIIANSQGFIESQIAAGTKTKKYFILSQKFPSSILASLPKNQYFEFTQKNKRKIIRKKIVKKIFLLFFFINYLDFLIKASGIATAKSKTTTKKIICLLLFASAFFSILSASAVFTACSSNLPKIGSK